VESDQNLERLGVSQPGKVFLFRLSNSLKTVELEVEILDESLNEPAGGRIGRTIAKFNYLNLPDLRQSLQLLDLDRRLHHSVFPLFRILKKVLLDWLLTFQVLALLRDLRLETVLWRTLLNFNRRLGGTRL
jgi:hypothetical protein